MEKVVRVYESKMVARLLGNSPVDLDPAKISCPLLTFAGLIRLIVTWSPFTACRPTTSPRQSIGSFDLPI